MSSAASFATAAARSKAKVGAGREGNGVRMGLGLARNSNRQGAGASEWRTWERGQHRVAVCGSAGERERAVGEEGEGTDKRAPLVGEREGKGGERPAGRLAGPRPRKESAGGGGMIWAKSRKGEGGKRKAFFSCLFSKQIFQTLSKNEFYSSHKRSAPTCMQQNISLNLYLILFS